MIEDEEMEYGFEVPENIQDYNIKTGENILTQIDPISQQIIDQNFWDYDYRVDPETGKTIRVRGCIEKRYKYNKDGSIEEKDVFLMNKSRYQDVLNASAWANSHLNRLMNIPRHIAYYLQEQWEGLFYDPLMLIYEENPQVRTVIEALNMIVTSNLMEAIEGSGASYNVKMIGGHRTQELVRRET